MTDEPVTNRSTYETSKALSAFIAEYASKHGRHAEMLISLAVTTAQLRAALGEEADKELMDACQEYVTYRVALSDANRTTERRIQLNGACTAETWNAEHPVGTRVRYWPVLPPIASAPPLDTTTRSEAWTLGCGEPVVKVVGRAGGVHLGHIELLETTGGKP